MTSPKENIQRLPVARPQLANYLALASYLKIIDETRVYSNFGPLQTQLVQRLQTQVFGQGSHVVACSSGTSALVAAITALQKRWGHKGKLCLVTAHSFVATAAAPELCGFTNVFVDVDPQTWALDPATVRQHPHLDRVGLVMVCSPYGKTIDLAAWQKFHCDTGIPVVVDAAASFDGVAEGALTLPSSIPVVLSLHATKSYSSGEGGLVISRDFELMAMATCSINHGFLGSRHAQMCGHNAKMSEYHAAVGLAELDGWKDKKAKMQKIGDLYQEHWKKAGAPGRVWSSPDVSSCYVLLETASGQDAIEYVECFDRAGIDVRFWYGAGLHKEAAFRNAAHPVAMTVTEDLSERLIGLPCFVDIGENGISRVVGALTC